MSNIPEEAGKVATSAVDAFKNNPACLAAILLAMVFAVLTFLAFQRDADRRSKTADLVMTRCFPYIDEHRRKTPPLEDMR